MNTADQTPTNQLSPEVWLTSAFLLIILVFGINLIFQWRMDVFGILRDPHGRYLVTSHHEPKAKYLLNRAYVPANFDALVIGASASENWDLRRFTGYRFYNESIEGGNASGQRKLVEQALPTGHFKVAIVCMFPRITSGHSLFDGLDKTRPEEAFGSLDAFTLEGSMLLARLRHESLESSPDGSHRLPSHVMKPDSGVIPEENIKEDPQAVADYSAMIQELRDKGTKIVYVIYPLYEPYYEKNEAEVAAFVKAVEGEYPAAPVVNLNDPEYKAFRSDPSNWIDEVHLSNSGAELLSPVINDRFHESLGKQR